MKGSYVHTCGLPAKDLTYLICRVHAGIDEMDIFLYVDLSGFLDVSTMHYLPYLVYYLQQSNVSSIGTYCICVGIGAI